MKQAKVKIQNDLTGILRSPSLYHVETTSKQWLIFVLFLLHFKFDTWVSKRPFCTFLTKFFKYFRQTIQNFRTAPPRSMRGQELLKTKSGEFEMVLSFKVSVLVALVESPSNIARIFQAQQLSCCGFMQEKYAMSSRVC